VAEKFFKTPFQYTDIGLHILHKCPNCAELMRDISTGITGKTVLYFST